MYLKNSWNFKRFRKFVVESVGDDKEIMLLLCWCHHQISTTIYVCSLTSIISSLSFQINLFYHHSEYLNLNLIHNTAHFYGKLLLNVSASNESLSTGVLTFYTFFPIFIHLEYCYVDFLILIPCTTHIVYTYI